MKLNLFLVDSAENLDNLASIIDFHERKAKSTVLPNHVLLKQDNAGRPIEISEIHAGDTDSSDDEDNKHSSEQKYNDFGKFTKAKLKENESKLDSHLYENQTTWKNLRKSEQNISTSVSQEKFKTKNQLVENYSDLYGLQIINPLISSQSLKEKMSSCQVVPLDKIKYHLNNLDPNKDWVIAGVIVSKITRTSQKGNQYCLWTLSDLKPGLKTVLLFLFGKTYTNLWKTGTGIVVAVLNPSVVEKKSTNNDVPALSINNVDQVMIWGTSKDFGVCKVIKKNGEPCSSFVNKRECEYCIYHVKQQYKKFTGRSELQSPNGGNLQSLRNKILGKNEVFYGGKSFTANTVLAKQNSKTVKRDQQRLMTLGGSLSSMFPSTLVKAQLLPARSQQIKDAERLRKLTGSPVIISSSFKKNLSCEKLKTFKIENKNSTNSKVKELQQELPYQNEKIKQLRNLSNLNQMIPNKNNSLKNEIGKTTLLKDDLLSSNSKCNLDSKCVINDNPTLELGSVNKFKYNEIRNVDCFGGKTALPPLNEIKQINTQNIDSKYNSMLQLVTGNPLKTKIQPTKTRFDNLIKSHSDVKGKSDSLNSTVESIILNPGKTSMIDLSSPITRKQAVRAKKNAVRIIQKYGPIKKIDPNAIRQSPRKGKKRTYKLDNDELEETENIDGKEEEKSVLSTRFLELMNITSQNEDLLENVEQKNLDEYYNKMEKKEQLEEKMLTTFKIDCKAVKCIKCKYKWFSASEHCKSEGHPLKVITAIKRFFKCKGCGNRTISLDIIPLHSCKQCGSDNWTKAPMMKERSSVNDHQLSIRGGEQKFMNSVESNGNLNLLMPE